MLHLLPGPQINDAAGQTTRDIKAPFHLTQDEEATVRRQIATIKPGNEGLVFHG